MRVLIFSDHHSHAWKPYSTILPDGNNDRLIDGINVLYSIRTIVKEHKVDVVLFAGDLFHVRGSLNVTTFNATYLALAAIKSAGCKLGLLVGNHDQVTHDGSQHCLVPFGTFATVMDKPGWYRFIVDGKYLSVLAIPYMEAGWAERAILDHTTDPKNPIPRSPKCLLGHLGIEGATVGSGFVMKGSSTLKLDTLCAHRFDQVFLGHYHLQQQLDSNVWYVGATMQHNWGDAGSNPGVLIWDTNNMAVPYALEAPKFINWEPKSHVSTTEVGNNFVRVPSAFNESLRDQFISLGARAVEFVPEAQTSMPVSEHTKSSASYRELIEKYVDDNSFDGQDLEALIRRGVELLGQ